MYKPRVYEGESLYDWICLSKKTKKQRSKVEKPNNIQKGTADSDDESDTLPTTSTGVNDSPASDLAHNVTKVKLDFVEDLVSDGAYHDDNDIDVTGETAREGPKNDRSFIFGHLQFNTHQAHMKKEYPSIVPNFLPNILPRSDCGDHEYYCCTMLTLFKPWRTGKDLKTNTESWDKTFVFHEFTKVQNEKMKFFNVRYECIDARDDFSAQRDKESS